MVGWLGGCEGDEKGVSFFLTFQVSGLYYFPPPPVSLGRFVVMGDVYLWWGECGGRRKGGRYEIERREIDLYTWGSFRGYFRMGIVYT